MSVSSKYWINKLKLIRHPEGGFYRELYSSSEFIQKKGLPGRYNSFRPFSTSIYFLLESSDFSAFHRLKSDEIWNFYQGSPINIYIILPDKKLAKVTLGNNPDNNEHFQFIIPKGTWFAAKSTNSGSFTLLGCTVAPGFDFDDFELGKREELIRKYPGHRRLITDFTRV